ncbi:antibiotic biosynthesis monooxygenase [Aureibaculum sp. 2210JD6-5]|uniref:putative quinol monooxygenase n=1 Tax=Aureibaculum sp. 2210JD6-5 TaxID=3103957 RepID=UPI002AAD7AF9|nr:antibiotic biosynthesis monooxygenase [Aureibaculum sp. 2210JD6-5]MDY7396648.1 antibiotic biosynthesis monooxygenase [Aureibaculum sp. 2210JD6-5]
MLIRIVKMSFKADKIEEFLSTFKVHKTKIRNSEGCCHLELLRDKNNVNIFFTYSHWKDEQDLENYRNSDLFNEVWAKTKVLFNDRPEAWSLERY